jgi:hypothetical protein
MAQGNEKPVFDPALLEKYEMENELGRYFTSKKPKKEKENKEKKKKIEIIENRSVPLSLSSFIPSNFSNSNTASSIEERFLLFTVQLTRTQRRKWQSRRLTEKIWTRRVNSA